MYSKASVGFGENQYKVREMKRIMALAHRFALGSGIASDLQ